MKRIAAYAFFVVFMSACAHDHLAEKSDPANPAELIVNIGSKEVKAGDKITAYRITCHYENLPRKGRTQECRHVEVGKVTVIEVLGPDKSRVRSNTESTVVTKDMHFEKEGN